MEYLLAQSGRGDLLSPLEHGEITLPEVHVEVQEDECLDVTICDAADIGLDTHTIGSSSSHDDLSTSCLVMSILIILNLKLHRNVSLHEQSMSFNIFLLTEGLT